MTEIPSPSDVCLVTGVGPGTGAAPVRAFAKDGCRIAMLARSAEHYRKALAAKQSDLDASQAESLQALNQRLIESAAAIEAISVDWNLGAAQVTRRAPARGTATEQQRIVAGSSGQGSIYVRMISLVDAILLPGIKEARIRANTLRQLLDTMRQHDSIHRHARSVHSCALFQGDGLLVSVEDVGRHNALDTISGWMALHGIRGGDKILFTTGRLTGEMVIKAAQSGIPIVVSRNGVSTMGYDVAEKLGMALFGRAVGRRFHCYVGSERLDSDD